MTQVKIYLPQSILRTLSVAVLEAVEEYYEKDEDYDND